MANRLVDQLAADHRRIRAIVDVLVRATEVGTQRRRELVSRLTDELLAHQRAEEQVVYPMLSNGDEAARRASEPRHDHAVIELLLDEVATSSVAAPAWPARMRALAEMIEHHFRDEERKLFGAAKDAVGQAEAWSVVGAMIDVRLWSLGYTRRKGRPTPVDRCRGGAVASAM